MILAIAMSPGHAAEAEDIPGIEFASARFAQAEQLDIPTGDIQWQSVELPDSWRKQKRHRGKIGWYLLTFTLPAAPSAPQALYIPRITNNVAVFINGTLIGVSGDIEAGEASWNVAQLFVVPPALLKRGANNIQIRLHPDGYSRAGLSRVYLGDEQSIRARYEVRHVIQTIAPQFITALLGVMATFSLAIWAGRRKEMMFAFFGLMCVVAIVRLLHHYIRDASPLLAYVTDPSICWMSALTASFMLRFAHEPKPRFENILYGFALLATIAIITVPGSWRVLTSSIVFASLALLSFAMLFVVGRVLLKQPSIENVIMLAGLIVNVSFGIHDFINYQELLEFDTLYLMPLGLPLVLFAVAVLIVKRFIATLHNYETLNAELAARVRDREHELAASYEKFRILDQQRAMAEERQHLMREMHDGIGSYLMSTLALARTGSLTHEQVTEALADCIDELKITIDSLEPVERDLLVVLGNLRYRLEPRLNAAGISLEWAVNDLPPLEYLDPENVRSVLRIVQEAFTNTLKHAGASRITLSTGVDYTSNRVLVRVTDDGRGLREGARNGRGIENMKNRAAKLRGQVELVGLRGGGTCMNLYLPITQVGGLVDAAQDDEKKTAASARTFNLL